MTEQHQRLVCEYTFKSPRLQQFSFPLDMVLKMAKNPTSSNVFQKLLETCKWFYFKNPILLIEEIDFYYNWTIKVANNKNFKVDPDSGFYKIWLIGKIVFEHHNLVQFMPKIEFPLSKFYRCDATTIYFSGVVISFNVIKHFIISPCLKDLRFESVEIKYSNGTPVTFDEILAILPSNVSELRYLFGGGFLLIHTEKDKNAIAFKNYRLYDFPNNFDVQKIYDSVKFKNIKLSLIFENSLLTQNYKDELENFIKNILTECSEMKFPPPMIEFPDLSQNLLVKLKTLHSDYEKYYGLTKPIF